jgi:Primosomal protein N'' (replication factor Y) - superfamily II helicase
MRYPPFVRLARILMTGTDETAVKSHADKMLSFLEREAAGGGLQLMGPAPAPLARVKDRYRYHIILKGKSGSVLRRALWAAQNGPAARQSKIAVVIDIDPQNLM